MEALLRSLRRRTHGISRSFSFAPFHRGDSGVAVPGATNQKAGRYEQMKEQVLKSWRSLDASVRAEFIKSAMRAVVVLPSTVGLYHMNCLCKGRIGTVEDEVIALKRELEHITDLLKDDVSQTERKTEDCNRKVTLLAEELKILKLRLSLPKSFWKIQALQGNTKGCCDSELPTAGENIKAKEK